MDVSLESFGTASSDLDSSQMSVDEIAEETVSMATFRAVESECAAWKARAQELESVLRKLEPLARLFGREKSGGSPTPTPEMSKLLLTELAQGREATVIVESFERLAAEFPILLDLNLGETDKMPRQVPKETFVRGLRYALDDLNKAQVRDFVDEATELTLAVDETPSPNGEKSFSATGVFDQNGRFMCIGFAENINKDGEGLAEATKRILTDAGCVDTVKGKIRTHGPGIMSDTSAAQKRANRIIMEHFTGEKHNGEESISCLMHLGKIIIT